jgi:chemotaxis protein histidine kinase CheA
MTDSDDIVKEFLAESAENLDRLDRNLVVLEKQPEDREILADIFRVIHTIKGTSGFLAFPRLEAVTHAGESLLTRLRDGHLSLTPEITTVLLAMVDAIRQMLEAIGRSGTDDGSDYPELIQQLTSLHDSGAVQKVADKSASPAGQAKASVGDPEKFPVMAGRLGAVLIEQGSVTAKQLARALEVQEKGNARPLGEILVESGALSPQELQEALKAPAEPHASAAEEATIRIRVGQLDRLMNLVGELVLARNRLQQWVAGQNDSRLLNTTQRLNLIITELQEGVMKARLQPIENVWNKFPRTVRDVARGCGKQVRIELEGKETELDKTIIEAIRDPLTHLVRNAVDHGIELPEGRRMAGKPAEGCLLLRAFHEGGQVIIEVADDGAGLDLDKIRNKAIEKGLLHPNQAAQMGERQIAGLIFLPGFSTAEQVTNVSGRGVGMDVVRTNIEKIGGTVDIQSRTGRGTTVRLKIPLTLAIIPALIVRSGGERYAIPEVSLVELLGLDGERKQTAIEMIQGAPVYRLRGQLLPLVYLNRALGEASSPPDIGQPQKGAGKQKDLLDFAHVRSRHLQWLERLRKVLDGTLSMTVDEAGSHRECALGQWLYGPGLKEYGSIREMHLLEGEHREFHGLVRAIVSRHLRGEANEAQRDYAKLEPASAKIVDLLSIVERQVLARRKVNIVVLQADSRQFGLVVDDIHDTEEIVVKPLDRQLKNVSLFAGATIMGDGRVVLILDVVSLAERAHVVREGRHHASTDSEVVPAPGRAATQERKPLLVLQHGEGSRLAIDLAAVTRLEEFPPDAVEFSGEQRTVQHCGRIMPLFRLSEVLGGKNNVTGTTAEPLEVVVVEGEGGSVGLIADRILDIADEAFAMDPRTGRTGVLGSAVIQQRVTDIVDVPDLLASLAAAPPPGMRVG